MPLDHWGEPIELKPRTFSLASLLAVVTLAACTLGWLNLVRSHPVVAAWCYVGLALVMATIVSRRQPGSLAMKVAAGIGFGLGAVCVGSYVFGWALLLIHGSWAAVPAFDANALRLARPPGWSEVDSFFVCFLGVLGAPVVTVIAWILSVAWTRLSNESRLTMAITAGGCETPRPR